MLDGVECTTEIKKHPHSASSLFQVRDGHEQEVDEVIHPDASVMNHEGAHQWSQMDQEQPLQCHHQMTRQSHRPVTVELLF